MEENSNKIVILKSVSLLSSIADSARTVADYISEISSSAAYIEISKGNVDESNHQDSYDSYKLNIGYFLTKLYDVVVDLSAKVHTLTTNYNTLDNKYVTIDGAPQTITGKKTFTTYPVTIENSLYTVGLSAADLNATNISATNISAINSTLDNLSANSIYAGKTSDKFNLSATATSVITQKLSCISTAELTAKHALWS